MENKKLNLLVTDLQVENRDKHWDAISFKIPEFDLWQIAKRTDIEKILGTYYSKARALNVIGVEFAEKYFGQKIRQPVYENEGVAFYVGDVLELRVEDIADKYTVEQWNENEVKNATLTVCTKEDHKPFLLKMTYSGSASHHVTIEAIDIKCIHTFLRAGFRQTNKS